MPKPQEQQDEPPTPFMAFMLAFESGEHTYAQLEQMIQTLPVSSRWTARLTLEQDRAELDPGD